MADTSSVTETKPLRIIKRLVDGLAERDAQMAKRRLFHRYSFNVPVSICNKSKNGALALIVSA